MPFADREKLKAAQRKYADKRRADKGHRDQNNARKQEVRKATLAVIYEYMRANCCVVCGNPTAHFVDRGGFIVPANKDARGPSLEKFFEEHATACSNKECHKALRAGKFSAVFADLKTRAVAARVERALDTDLRIRRAGATYGEAFRRLLEDVQTWARGRRIVIRSVYAPTRKAADRPWTAVAECVE